MSRAPTPSLRRLLLGHELAFLVLVAVTGGIGGTWAYFWQQTSTESLRLNDLRDLAQEIRTLLFRQVHEVAVARLRGTPDAQAVYARYYQDIQARFNALRQRSESRAEDYAIQHLQEAYGQLQNDLNGLFGDSYLLNRILRSKLLDPDFEGGIVQGFEEAFKSFNGLITQQLAQQSAHIAAWTRYAPVIVPLPLVIAIGLIIGSRASLQRGFVFPIRNILQGTRRLSEGDADLRLPDEGVAEIAELARGINQMAQDLAASRAALIESERQAALGALVPVVAHNIRNPLASIRANAQLLEHAEGRAETVEIGQAIVEAVDRLGRWVSALVSYLHPLRPQLARRPAVTLFEAIVELLRPRLAEKQVEVRREPWDEAAEVSVDADLMEQALYGLVANALEASPHGGTLTLGVAPVARTVCLTVRDQGGGIPFIPNPSDLAPGPTTKRFGTGLGIPVAFKVCKAHGWSLSFSVLDNEGTLVTITAPSAGERA